MEELSLFPLRNKGALSFPVEHIFCEGVEELSQLLLGSRGAAVFCFEKEKSSLSSYSETKELSPFFYFETEEVYCCKKERGGEGTLSDLVEE